MEDRELLHHEQIAAGACHSRNLLLLHGWGHSLEQMRGVAQLLAFDRHVHLLDLPGFGRSAPPQVVWSAFDYAEEVKRYLDRKQLAQVDLVGHSFGGKVAVCLALRYPERVGKLLLMAPALVKPVRSSIQRLRIELIGKLGRLVKRWDRLAGSGLFERCWVPYFGSSDYRRASGVMRSILVRSVNEDLQEQLAALNLPTFLLWGQEDQQTPVEMAYRIERAIRGAKLVVLAHKGHLLFQDAGAHLCAYHLLRFLQGSEEPL